MNKDTKKSELKSEKFIRAKYLRMLKKHKIGLLAPTAWLVGLVIAINIVPIVYADFIQRLVGRDFDSFKDILAPLTLFTGLHLVRYSLFALSDVAWVKASVAAQKDLTLEGHDVIASQSKSFFANNYTGSVMSMLDAYYSGFQEMLRIYTYLFLAPIVTIIFMIIYIGSKSPVLVLPFVFSIVVYGVFVTVTTEKRRQINRVRTKLHTEFKGRLSDSVSSMEIVKSEGAEKKEISMLIPSLTSFLIARERGMSYSNKLGRFTALTAKLLEITAILFAAYLFLEKRIDLSLVLVMISYSSSLVEQISSLSSYRRSSQDLYNSTFEMAEIMMTEPEIKDPKNPVNLKIKDGQIEFQGANFKYTNSSEEVKDNEVDQTPKSNKKEQAHLFKNLDLTINPGERIGLVGPSGGGKSTLLKLILRFYDVDSGSIKIDGVNVKDVIQSKLRQQIAYVPQDPALFHRSIGENIGYSKPKAKQSQIEQAAKQAYADEFINTLPDGYDTLVGERGVKLSGGQRQRVAIARAILKDAPILLLDEATSALDSESERYIQKSLEKLMKGRTTVVVAHRLSTIQKMDRILVIDGGKVIASGPHEELLKTSPLYKKLWSHQSGGMLQD